MRFEKNNQRKRRIRETTNGSFCAERQIEKERERERDKNDDETRDEEEVTNEECSKRNLYQNAENRQEKEEENGNSQHIHTPNGLPNTFLSFYVFIKYSTKAKQQKDSFGMNSQKHNRMPSFKSNEIFLL